jgi:hypothetical protein
MHKLSCICCLSDGFRFFAVPYAIQVAPSGTYSGRWTWDVTEVLQFMLLLRVLGLSLLHSFVPGAAVYAQRPKPLGISLCFFTQTTIR